MICELCKQDKDKLYQIQDFNMCAKCVCVLVDIVELDIRDFM